MRLRRIQSRALVRVSALVICFGVAVPAIVFAAGGVIGLVDVAEELSAAVGMLLAAVGLLGLLPSLFGEKMSDRSAILAGLADSLAQSIRRRESERYNELVPTTVEIDLRFSVASAAPDCLVPPVEGRLTTIATEYRQLSSGRLVMTGRGGSGKTVLLVALALQLLKLRQNGEKVPIRLSMSRWDAEQPFAEWASEEISALSGIPVRSSRELIDGGFILPLLDGLDEMDPTSNGRPARAAKALHQLSPPQVRYLTGPVPLVITCRDDVYLTLKANREHLLDAATLHISALTPAEIVAQIQRTVADRGRWETVVRRIETESGWSLTTELNVPWHLAIALALYDGRKDGIYERDIRDLEQFETSHDYAGFVALYADALIKKIPAMSGSHSSQRGVRRALETLGHYLERNSARRQVLGGRVLSGVDLVPHQLWPVAGVHAPRIMTVFLSLLLWVPGIAATCWLLNDLGWFPLPGAAILAAISLLPAISIRGSAQWWPHPRRLVPARLKTRRGKVHLVVSLAIALVLGIALIGLSDVRFALAFAIPFAVVFGLGCSLAVRDSANSRVLLITGAAVGLLMALIADLVVGFMGAVGGIVSGVAGASVALFAAVAVAVRAPSAHPGYVRNPVFYSFIRGDLHTGLVAAAGAAIVVATALVLDSSLYPGVVQTAAISISVGISVGLGFVADAWRRYVAMLLCMTGRLPLRLGRSLGFAYDVGLLRLAGIAYQFRHGELRDSFSRQARARPRPSSRT